MRRCATSGPGKGKRGTRMRRVMLCVLVAAALSLGTLTPSAYANSSQTAPVLVGDSCGHPTGANIGSVRLARSGSTLKVAWSLTLPNADQYDVELWTSPACDGIDNSPIYRT